MSHAGHFWWTEAEVGVLFILLGCNVLLACITVAFLPEIKRRTGL